MGTTARTRQCYTGKGARKRKELTDTDRELAGGGEIRPNDSVRTELYTRDGCSFPRPARVCRGVGREVK